MVYLIAGLALALTLDVWLLFRLANGKRGSSDAPASSQGDPVDDWQWPSPPAGLGG